ncbi:polysaccharide lyase family 7 protein [Actinokineospora sp.]|uniref:polysaccharide lyase family 7 protein n=1 Tax=Actinokineospora sp. TaxID=1872133 RepID=UPI004037B8CD
MKRVVLSLGAVAVLTAVFVPSAIARESAAPQTVAACKYPAEILNLANWKVTLPTGSSGKPTEIKQPQLRTYAKDPHFVPAADCAGVRFRAPVNGVTTSGSKYPRSELREMTKNGSDNAKWSTTSGTHTMIIQEAITRLPKTKPHVVAGQIHGGDDDVTVFRLEGTKLYVTDGDNAKHKLVTSSYQLGTRFEAKFVASGGKIKVYYNGALQTTLSKKVSSAYFKAGAYTQANCGNSSPCSKDNYGEVVIYGLKVTHT